MIVLCSSDLEYLAVAGGLFGELQSRGLHVPVLIAGNPESASELRAAGVTEFIHLRSHPIEVLTRLQHLLGIGR